MNPYDPPEEPQKLADDSEPADGPPFKASTAMMVGGLAMLIIAGAQGDVVPASMGLAIAAVGFRIYWQSD